MGKNGDLTRKLLFSSNAKMPTALQNPETIGRETRQEPTFATLNEFDCLIKPCLVEKNRDFCFIMSKQSQKSENKNTGSIAEVGLMADFGRKKAVLNPQLLEELRQKEVETLMSQLRIEAESKYENLLRTFTLRFNEEPEIFDGIDAKEVFVIFENTSRIMLAFFPSRISADVTFDASVILQAHYGSFRVYWETFIPKDQEQPYYSTLNVYAEQTLMFTGGGKAEEMMMEFVQFITPLFKKMVRLQIV